jgi:hypothetical protein
MGTQAEEQCRATSQRHRKRVQGLLLLLVTVVCCVALCRQRHPTHLHWDAPLLPAATHGTNPATLILAAPFPIILMGTDLYLYTPTPVDAANMTSTIEPSEQLYRHDPKLEHVINAILQSPHLSRSGYQ